jgi:hypothetical protein
VPGGSTGAASVAGDPAGVGRASSMQSASTALPTLSPSIQSATLAAGRYDILAMETELRNMNEWVLRVPVRMTTTSQYPANFWDATFRLVIDGVPRAPISGLNEVVPGNSAVDGEVEFVVPANAGSLVLRLLDGSNTVDIPIRTIMR